MGGEVRKEKEIGIKFLFPSLPPPAQGWQVGRGRKLSELLMQWLWLGPGDSWRKGKAGVAMSPVIVSLVV